MTGSIFFIEQKTIQRGFHSNAKKLTFYPVFAETNVINNNILKTSKQRAETEQYQYCRKYKTVILHNKKQYNGKITKSKLKLQF